MKVTERTTKNAMVKFLKEAKVKDKTLAGEIKNALTSFAKDMTSVPKSVLIGLIDKINLSATLAPVEASLKPKSTGKPAPKKTAPPVEEETEEVAEEEAEVKTPAPKKSKAGAKTPKTSKPEKAEVKAIPPLTVQSIDAGAVRLFPAKLEHKDLGNLIAVPDMYHTYSDILEALNSDKTLYFACYWSKKLLKKFDYGKVHDLPVSPKEFDYDLDIAMAVLPCETMEKLYAMSQYTEALYVFKDTEFAPIQDVDPRSGEEFQVRVSYGMEFEIYVPESEA